MSGELTVVAAMRAELPRPMPRGARALVVGAGARRLAAGALAGRVVVVGTCGALDRGLGAGTLVIADGVVDADGRRWSPDPALAQELGAALDAVGAAHAVATFAHASGVADAPRDREALARATLARCVDMESAVVAAACAARGLPWAVMRTVTDTPDEPLAFLAELLGGVPLEEPHPLRVAAALARRPRHLGRLLRLGRYVARGRRGAGAALARVTG